MDIKHWRYGWNVGCAIGLSAAWLFACAGSVQGDVVVFQDHFDNGNANNSDTITGFWSVHASTPGMDTVSESTYLTSTATSNVANPHISLYSAVSDDFNFYTHKLQFDLNFVPKGVDGNTSGGAYQRVLNFGLTSDGNSYDPSSAADAFLISINGTMKVTVKTRINGGSMVTLINNAALDGPSNVKGFRLTMDATVYSLVFYDTNSNVIPGFPMTGAHGLTLGNWGTQGDSNVILWTQRNDGTATSYAKSQIDDLTVTQLSIPEPASLGLLTLGSLTMFVRRRP